MKKKIGYYWVKFYNHNELKILYWNGLRFEGFPSDDRIHDEIEKYKEVDPRNDNFEIEVHE